MRLSIRLSFVLMMILSIRGWGAPNLRTPHAGYVYPAGGRRGTSFSVTVGGQYLRDIKDVQFSGTGIRGDIVEYIRPLNRKQLNELRLRMHEIRRKRRGLKIKKKPGSENIIRVDLPDHPLLRDLDQKSNEDLLKIRDYFFNKKKQENRQLEETLRINITIDSSAEPGEREMRLITKNRFSNPQRFQVGKYQEVFEEEPNDLKDEGRKPATLPFLLNGQIMPGDVDRFRFRGEKGKTIVLDVDARILIPYLADAVPGWFQPVLAVYDDNGKEVAYADDYFIDPDPRLTFEIPRNGIYELEIRDAVYRGREDFVYRIRVEPESQRREKKIVSEFNENEPNDNPKNLSLIELPQVINGRIDKSEDTDIFRFKGKKGDEIVAEIQARRINSPLDSLLRLTDESGKVLDWNDDFPIKNTGLLTHHADSYIRTSLPRDGLYDVRVSDAQKHGGENYTYKLYIGPPRPGFSLYMNPSSISIPPGRSIPITIHAIRRDGFSGEIRFSIDEPARGFHLNGGVLPAGRDSIRMTLSSPPKGSAKPFTLQMSGQAEINQKKVREPVIPTEDVMQAFLWRHLVPSKDFKVIYTRGGRSGPPIKLQNKTVRIPAGSSARVRMKTPRRAPLEKVELKLSEAPQGISLSKVDYKPGLLSFELTADVDSLKPGFTDNLIVEAFMERTWSRPGKGGQNGKKASGSKKDNPQKSDLKKKTETVKVTRKVSIGFLPAIPIEALKP